MKFFNKKKNKQTDNKFIFRFEKYDKGIQDFCIFAGLEDEEIQKNEHIWVSWQAMSAMINDTLLLKKFANDLEKATNMYVEKELKRM